MEESDSIFQPVARAWVVWMGAGERTPDRRIGVFWNKRDAGHRGASPPVLLESAGAFTGRIKPRGGLFILKGDPEYPALEALLVRAERNGP